MYKMEKVILDVDTGIDDAQAIMLAVSLPNIEVLGITCVHGNVDVHMACTNTLRVLRVCNRLDIPVYKGAACSVIGSTSNPTTHHGSDGLGDRPDPNPPSPSLIQREHAVPVLIRLAKEYPGEITLLALAPLTNLALALRLDDGFGRRLKKVIIMGGNLTASGSRASMTADFNFAVDPEAAFVCMRDISCPITLLPYDICSNSRISWNQLSDILATPTKKATYLSAIMEQSNRYKRDQLQLDMYFTCDPLAVLLVCDTDIATTESVTLAIELRGDYTKGLSVVSKQHIKISNMPEDNRETCSCDVVLNVDVQKFWSIFKDILSDSK